MCPDCREQMKLLTSTPTLTEPRDGIDKLTIR